MIQNLVVCAFLLGATLWSGNSRAEDKMQGTVEGINVTRMIIIEHGHWGRTDIRTNAGTAYEGVDGLRGLVPGDAVEISYQTVNGSRVATVIHKVAPEEEQSAELPAETAAPSTEPPPAQ